MPVFDGAVILKAGSGPVVPQPLHQLGEAVDFHQHLHHHPEIGQGGLGRLVCLSSSIRNYSQSFLFPIYGCIDV